MKFDLAALIAWLRELAAGVIGALIEGMRRDKKASDIENGQLVRKLETDSAVGRMSDADLDAHLLQQRKALKRLGKL